MVGQYGRSNNGWWLVDWVGFDALRGGLFLSCDGGVVAAGCSHSVFWAVWMKMYWVVVGFGTLVWWTLMVLIWSFR